MPHNLTLIPDHGYAGHEYYGANRMLRANGFTVNLLSPPWDKKVGEIVAYAQQGVDNAPGDKPILFGHSVGGNLALISASRTPRKLGGLIIASNSILCANSLQYPRGREAAEESYPGQQEEIKQYEIKALAEDVGLYPSQIAVLVGEGEVKKSPHMGKLARTTAEALEVDVTIVPGAPHFVEYSDSYIRAIANAALQIHVANLGH